MKRACLGSALKDITGGLTEGSIRFRVLVQLKPMPLSRFCNSPNSCVVCSYASLVHSGVRVLKGL